MYQEWMDGVPLLFDGFSEYNVVQLQKAKEYYIRKNDIETVKNIEKAIIREKERIKKELNKPSKFKQIINIILK